MKNIKAWIPLLVIALGIVLIYIFGLEHYLSLTSLKEHHAALKENLAEHPILAPFLFTLGFTLFVALCLPGDIFLSLLGGYLFPQPFSTLYVVIAATCGGTLIFSAVRLAAGAFLKREAKPFVKKMRKGFLENGVSYMLFMRFFPLFPYWIVNIAPAFLGLSRRTFVWTTLVGVIPSSLIFTLAGQGLEKIVTNTQTFAEEAIFISEFKVGLTLLSILALTPIFVKMFKKKFRKNAASKKDNLFLIGLFQKARFENKS